MPRQTTKCVRVEFDVTFDAARTPAQIDVAVAALQARLAGVNGVTIGLVVVSSFAPPDFAGWPSQ